MSTVVVVGNPKARSRTLDAAIAVAEQVTGRAPDVVVDLADLGAGLLDWSDPAVAAAVDQVRGARFVVVASPTYKASYTGLLKLFLDRFPAGALAGVTVVPLMLGGGLQHALAPEVFLKPVLAEIGASMPTRALFLLDSDAEAGFDTSPALAQWMQAAGPQLAGSV